MLSNTITMVKTSTERLPYMKSIKKNFSIFNVKWKKRASSKLQQLNKLDETFFCIRAFRGICFPSLKHVYVFYHDLFETGCRRNDQHQKKIYPVKQYL